MSNIRTHYDNLKVVRNAPASVIKAAYKALCQTYHPDKFQGSNQEAERVMKLINTSYEVLIDPIKRRLHDDWIKEQETKEDKKNRQSETEDSSDQSHHQKKNTQQEYTQKSQANDTKSSATAQPSIIANNLFTIGFIIYLIWASIQYLNTNKTIPVTARAEQTLNAEDILQRADNLYNQGKYVEAFSTFRQLAEQGQPIAQNNLGFMYANGRGVTKNYKKAVAWYRKSAEQGEAVGQYSLGKMYSEGRGVTQDNNQAAAWYRKAAEQGEEKAITALNINRTVINNFISDSEQKKYKSNYVNNTLTTHSESRVAPSRIRTPKKKSNNRDLRKCLSLSSNEDIAECVENYR
jgi:curved DNA-binding protein CbpA